MPVLHNLVFSLSFFFLSFRHFYVMSWLCFSNSVQSLKISVPFGHNKQEQQENLALALWGHFFTLLFENLALKFYRVHLEGL